MGAGKGAMGLPACARILSLEAPCVLLGSLSAPPTHCSFEGLVVSAPLCWKVTPDSEAQK